MSIKIKELREAIATLADDDVLEVRPVTNYQIVFGKAEKAPEPVVEPETKSE